MWKKIALALLALFLVCALALTWLLNRPYEPALTLEAQPLTNMAEAPTGKIWFESFHAGKAKDLLAGPDGAVHEPVFGTLFLPEGASAEHPVPAMVILHGSGGEDTGRAENLARKLATVGIAGFAVDSFASRGLRPLDGTARRLGRVPIYTQVADAMGALKALSQHPFLKVDRIGVAGASAGASSALLTAFEPVTEPVLGKPPAPRFAAHVLFYGGANVDFEDFRTDHAPVLLLIGGRDETTPKAQAEAFVERLKAAGSPAQLKIYPEAGHGWDLPFPTTFAKDAIVTANCVAYWKKDGSVVEKASGRNIDNPFSLFLAFRSCAGSGVTTGRNDAANRQSVRDMLRFLEAQWGGDFVSKLGDDTLDIGIQKADEGI